MSSLIHIKPLTGAFNVRDTPDAVPFGAWRWVQNFRTTSRDKVCRTNGFVKHLDRENYNNQDLHDALFEAAEQPVTMLFQAVSTMGIHKLIAGTQNRLYALNNSTGNWVVISDELGGAPEVGCPEKRFKAAQINDTLIFTNGVDKPVYYIFDQPPLGPDDQSVTTLRDLDNLNLTKASVVAGWKGLMIMGNVVMDGIRVSHRLIWSDFDRPQSWRPSNASVAGYVDLGSGEDILAFEPLGDILLIYTTNGIWQASAAVGSTTAISVARRYAAGERRNRCLGYPNTLVSTGQDHYFLGKDGVYVYNMFLPEPTRLDWVHGASSLIFDNLRRQSCSVPCAGFNALTKEVWISWADSDATCNNKTLVINADFPFVSYTDHGFTAFCNYVEDNPYTFRQFLLDYCICSYAGMDENGLGFIKEGGYCLGTPDALPCEFEPASIYTTDELTIGDVTTEDYTKEEADADSLCALLNGLTFDNLCDPEFLADECEAKQSFVMASAQDNCLKQSSEIFYREFCVDRADCGEYATEGYISILRSGPLDFKAPHDVKRISRVEVEAHMPMQTVPSNLDLRVGYSARAADPNDEGHACQVRWVPYTSKALECLTTSGASNPGRTFQWPVFADGDFLYFELKVTNPNVTPVNTGGEVCLSRVSLEVDKLTRSSLW